MPKLKRKSKRECPKCIRHWALTGELFCQACAKYREAKRPATFQGVSSLLDKNTKALQEVDKTLNKYVQHMLASLTPREMEVFKMRFPEREVEDMVTKTIASKPRRGSQ